MNANSYMNRIIPVDDVARIKSRCLDKDMLLDWNLGFRYGVISVAAGRLGSDDFFFEEGRPKGFCMPESPGMCMPPCRSQWYVPLWEDDRDLFNALLPARGERLFSERDPYRRLLRVAEREGIPLTRRQIRATFLV